MPGTDESSGKGPRSEGKGSSNRSSIVRGGALRQLSPSLPLFIKPDRSPSNKLDKLARVTRFPDDDSSPPCPTRQLDKAADTVSVLS